MGWTSTHRDKGITNLEWFSQELGPTQSIVEHATVGRNVFYAAVREDKTGEVWALVVLTQWAPKTWHNFTWKTMSEDMGPVESRAPQRILDALTPTESQYANEWRQRCRDHIASVAARPRIPFGTTIRLDQPLNFTDGVQRDTFTFIKGSHFRSDDGVNVRVSRWRERAFAVVA